MEDLLSTKEQNELKKQEAIIEKSLPHAFALGAALDLIQAGRLYRNVCSTFEEYCSERWDLTRKYAYRRIRSAKTRKSLEKDPRINVLPRNERQIRSLAKLGTEAEQVEAYVDASKVMENETGEALPPVTRLVEEAVEARLPKPQAKPKPKQVECSECGRWYVPPHSYWDTHDPAIGRPALTEQRRILRGIEDHIAKVTGLKIPAPKTEKQKKAAAVFWYQIEREFAELSNWSLHDAEILVAKSAEARRDSGIMIESPKTIIGAARAIAAGQSSGKATALDLLKQDFQQNQAEIEEARRAT